MKKFLVTILALVYLTSTVGATLRLDCCLENLVTLGLDAHLLHDTCSKENKDCNNEHKQAKPGYAQKHTNHPLRVAKSLPATLPAFPAYSLYAAVALPEAYPVNHAPPQQAACPLFILHCVHRI